MDSEKAQKILNSARSSKEELREALAFALGVEQKAHKNEKGVSIFTECKNVFANEYNKYTGLRYNFQVKDGVALAGIIKKIEANLPPAPSQGGGEKVVNTFTALVQNLPVWYKEKAFSLSVINSKYNEIIASITKKAGTNNGNSSEREAVRAAFSGTNKP